MPVNEKQEFPPHPFWNYSLRLYSQPGVEDACLTLQDEFDLDVNIVLFCLWAGTAGPGQLTAAEMTEALARGGQWQREVVQRLRHIRRTLKKDVLGATSELVDIFRPRAQQLELAAEHAQQLLLAGIVPEARGQQGIDPAIRNLHTYFEESGLAADGSARNAMLLILTRAFPDTDAADIEARWSRPD